jgi:hypothetical protein
MLLVVSYMLVSHMLRVIAACTISTVSTACCSSSTHVHSHLVIDSNEY